jgi:hypothetical protein
MTLLLNLKINSSIITEKSQLTKIQIENRHSKTQSHTKLHITVMHYKPLIQLHTIRDDGNRQPLQNILMKQNERSGADRQPFQHYLK